MVMTDNEIIKALECCKELSDCDGCQYGYLRTKNGLCIDTMHNDALSLINRQKAEIERLKETIDSFADIGKLYSEIKAEAVKEFAKRLKPMLGFGKYMSYEEIDNLVAEMVGEENA